MKTTVDDICTVCYEIDVNKISDVNKDGKNDIILCSYDDLNNSNKPFNNSTENAEYDAAKEAQGMLEMKIAKLEEVLAGARLIDESQLDTSKVLVLSKVKIKTPESSKPSLMAMM